MTIRLIFAFLFLSIFFSCRNEESEFINTSSESNELLTANDNISNLIQQISLKDGSIDNILDGFNCITLRLPVMATVNGINLTIEDESDFDRVEQILDEFPEDNDSVELIYPVTVILSDFREVTIFDEIELNELGAICPNQNTVDDDIECVDFEFPFRFSIFNTSRELFDTVTIEDDKNLFEFISEITQDDIISITFPVTLILAEGTKVQINSLSELESTIEGVMDECDEDDDNDFNDDDCSMCDATQLTNILTECPAWTISILQKSGGNQSMEFDSFHYSFSTNGEVTVASNQTSFTGVWNTSGNGNSLTIAINIPEQQELNEIWNVSEIKENPVKNRIDLRLDNDRLRFESNCEDIVDDTPFIQELTQGDWLISSFTTNNVETADDFNSFVFNFDANGIARATNPMNTPPITNGLWSTSPGIETDIQFNLDFNTTASLENLNQNWGLLEATSEIIRLKNINNNTGEEIFMIFERTLSNTVLNELEMLLIDNAWEISRFINNSGNSNEDNEQTSTFSGYVFTFASSGSVTADNGTDNISGSWRILNGGNTIRIDFDTQTPFNDISLDWEITMTQSNRINLKHQSIGSGTDLLEFQVN